MQVFQRKKNRIFYEPSNLKMFDMKEKDRFEAVHILKTIDKQHTFFYQTSSNPVCEICKQIFSNGDKLEHHIFNTYHY